LGLLGDPTRRAIFELLARRPSSVQELADQLPISRPAVSQHLKVLRDGGLVVSQPEGTRRIYRLNPHGVAALRTWLEGVWDQALTDFHKVAEQTTADNLSSPTTASPTRRQRVSTPNRSSHARSDPSADRGQDHRERSG
jgi:DNA-binding transcriptional ArsR family regulator